MEPLKVLIPHDVNYQKYFPFGTALPYEATGRKLRDEILKRTQGVDVIWAASERETIEEIRHADYLVAGSIEKKLLEQASKLRWLQCSGSGIDHFFKRSDVTLEELTERGIMFFNSAGVNSHVVAEHILAMMLICSRQMLRAIRQQRRRQWDIFCADELSGKTVGIIGLGAIGMRVAELTKGFGMTVIGTKRHPNTYTGVADEVLPATELPQILTRSDYVVLACPITDENRAMIAQDTLALMKPTAYLINCARGELVDEDALVQALKSGRIAGAGLDTFGPLTPQRTEKDQEALSPESELWDLENVIICPNNASGSPKIFEYLADIVAKNLRLIQSGQDPIGRKM